MQGNDRIIGLDAHVSTRTRLQSIQLQHEQEHRRQLIVAAVLLTVAMLIAGGLSLMGYLYAPGMY